MPRRRETTLDALRRLNGTINEAEEMMRGAVIFYMIGAHAYGLLWRHHRNLSKPPIDEHRHREGFLSGSFIALWPAHALIVGSIQSLPWNGIP